MMGKKTGKKTKELSVAIAESSSIGDQEPLQQQQQQTPRKRGRPRKIVEKTEISQVIKEEKQAEPAQDVIESESKTAKTSGEEEDQQQHQMKEVGTSSSTGDTKKEEGESEERQPPRSRARLEADYEIAPLPDNPTMQEIKTHKERMTKKFKAKSCLHSVVSKALFTKIMALESTRDIWDYLRTESQGNERSRSMQVMNLKREFEIQRMKESETIKEYSDRLLSIVNKAQEQRRLIRQEGFVEGALQAKLQIQDRSKGKKKKGNKDKSNKGNAGAGDNNNKGGIYPQCQHCKKTNHPQSKCWWRPDIKCRKCNQLGHIEKVCRSKQQQEGETNMVDQQKEEHLFVALCYASKSSNEHWHDHHSRVYTIQMLGSSTSGRERFLYH
ncbi:hypothetical protein F0562_035998 [Nyssa sinensis]|uniref:CCHC-type domain-containing protein n=1 Tax=Nyssa sinensis TaxID=561372 RepID=A0A5J5ACG3_9ASTE|nr:hypothetical protein F0562_035998 [Nyssa sinensis]